ncbi:MAG: hypothetical protein QM482_07105 [Sulfurospirillum sp.]
MNLLYTTAVLFLLPLFPLSLITNRVLSALNPRLFSTTLLVLFIVGNILLNYADIESKTILFLAIFTILFYSFRLLGVKSLKNFILYLYPIVSSISLVWYMVGGDVLEILALKTPVLVLFLTLFTFLSGQFSVIHQKSISGLGGVMPRFSILFILSLLGLSSSLFFWGYELLELEFSKLPLFYTILLIISWIFINWGSIKLFEWLIYGEYKQDTTYEDLNAWQTLALSLILFGSAVFFIFYGAKGLV